MSSAVKVSDLSITYSGFTHPAINRVSLDIPEGKISALIGPNGSGKSSLMKAILGLVPYKGKIEVFGKPVGELAGQVSYVPQRVSFDLTFPITVAEFIHMPETVLKPSVQKKAVVSEALERVGAPKLENRHLSSLSGGQLQRVLLARALATHPKLLMLDEPEAGVDVGGEQTFYDLVEELVGRDQLTVIVASHELDVVYTYAEHVVCLNQEVVCVGKPQEVLTQQTFEELYGRSLKFYGHAHRHHHSAHVHPPADFEQKGHS